MYELICNKCGWYSKTYNLNNTSPTCPKCQATLSINFDDNDEDIATHILMHENNVMRKNLKSLGNDEVWNMIEKLSNPISRVSQRQVFFRNGGKVPKRS